MRDRRINWQFEPTKQFDAEDFAAFLRLLPKRVDGHTIRHALEVRHDSFKHPEFIALASEHGVAAVVAGDSRYPQIADLTAPFVYARIMGTDEAQSQGYSGQERDEWAERVRRWASGGMPEGLETVGGNAASPIGTASPRDVYLYVISGFKAHNPAAGIALIERVGRGKAK